MGEASTHPEEKNDSNTKEKCNKNMGQYAEEITSPFQVDAEVLFVWAY